MKHFILFIKLFFSLTLISYSFCGDEPALKINLNPPEENVKDTIGNYYNNNQKDALKDMAKLEDDLRLNLDEVR